VIDDLEMIAALELVGAILAADDDPELADIGRCLFLAATDDRRALEAAELTEWTAEVFAAIEAMVAPVALSRGPPAYAMTSKCKRAPGRFLARGSLKIVSHDHTTFTSSSAMLPPCGAIVRSGGDVATDAANLTLSGGRYVLAG
jgi:hypothetical protein